MNLAIRFTAGHWPVKQLIRPEINVWFSKYRATTILEETEPAVHQTIMSVAYKKIKNKTINERKGYCKKDRQQNKNCITYN
jgi:hypothetical protein